MAGYDPSYFTGASKSGSLPKIPTFGIPMSKDVSSGDLTANQLALLMALKKRDKHFSLGHMLKEAGKHSLNPVLWTFDKIMRPSYAVASGTDAALSHGGNPYDALKGAWSGFSGQNKEGFGEVLSHHGVLKGHGHLKGLLGFSADVVTDPLFLASAAAAPFTGGSSVAGYAALKAAAVKAGEKLGEDVLAREARRAAYDAGQHAFKGEVTPDVVEILKKAGKGYEARHGLAEQVVKQQEAKAAAGITGDTLQSDALIAAKSLAADIAHAEERKVTKYGPSLRYGTRKHGIATPVEIGGKRILPALPKAATIAMRGVPGISHITNKLGEKFIPGFKREELHAAEIGRQHYAEASAVNQRDYIAEIMSGKHGPAEGRALTHEVGKLSREEQLHALHLFEQPLKRTKSMRWKAITKFKGIHGEAAYKINDKYANHLLELGAKGDVTGITPAQMEFVRRWHQATQYLHVRDREAGVKYSSPHLGEQGRLYVPHIMDRSGDPLATSQLQKNLFSQAGFQKKIQENRLSLSHIHDMVKKGELPDAIETDPYKLLTHTSRSRAEKQADMAMIHSIERAYGVPTRIVDKAAVEKTVKRANTAAKKFESASKLKAHAEQDVQDHIELYREHLVAEHKTAVEAIQKKIRSLKFGKLDNAKLEGTVKAINDTFEKGVEQLKRTVKTERTRMENVAKKAREEADAAEATAEKAIKGKVTFVKAAAPKHFEFGIVRAKGKYIAFTQEAGSKTRVLLGERGTKAEAQATADGLKGVHDAAHAKHAADKGKRTVVRNKAYITRTTREAARKMDIASEAEKKLAHTPAEVSQDDIFKLQDARDAAIKKAEHMARVNQKRTKGATIKVMENRIARLNAEHAAALDRITNGTHAALNKNLADPKKMLKAAREAQTDARNELRLAKKAWNKTTLGKRNPAYNRKVHVAVGKSTDEWGNAYGYSKEVAQSLERLKKITTGEEKTVDDFAKGWGKFMSTWKLAVTSVNPGYRFRNSMTDFWNMWVSGVPARLIPVYGAEATKVMVRAKKGDLDALNTITEAATHGVLSGLYTGDVQAVAKYIAYGDSKRALLKKGHGVKAYVKLMQDMNRNAENWGRLTHYLYQTRSMHLPPSQAALKVKLAHFDYEDLTPFEQKVMKKVFPFYTWSRKNIPFQVKMIMQHPGRYAAFPKGAAEAEQASGADPNEEIPGYLADSFAFHIGKHRVFTPQFGVSDLMPFQSPKEALQRVESMVTPVIKTPTEMALNKSFFSGQPIASDTHPRTPVNRLGADLLKLIPGSNVGQTQRQGVSGPGANPYYAYLLGQIPMLREATVSTGGIKGKTPGTDPYLSYFGGLSTQTYDPKLEQDYATADATKAAKKFLTGLRDEGTIPPAKKRKKSKKEQYIQRQIFG